LRELLLLVWEPPLRCERLLDALRRLEPRLRLELPLRPALLLRLELRFRPELRRLEPPPLRELELRRLREDSLRAEALPFGGGGTLSPSFRASDSPIAIACFRLVTRPPWPCLPRRRVPCLRRRMARSTSLLAARP
jgi:hypothetical protein